MNTKVVRRLIVSFSILVLMMLMLLVYILDETNSAQLIAIALPLLAIYHYKRRVWLTCLYSIFAMLCLVACMYVGLLVKHYKGSMLSSTFEVSYVIIVACLVLWSIVVLTTWLGWVLVTRNIVFRYAWQHFIFANSISTMTGILVCMISEKPANWFDNGGKYILSIGMLYMLMSWVGNKVKCK